MHKPVLALLAALSISAAPLAAGATPIDIAQVDAAATEMLATEAPGLAIAVVRDGRLIYERSYGQAQLGGAPVEADTVFRLASVTKVFTAAAILQLEAQGRLALADPLSEYVPELPQAGHVTLGQLLTHTGGLPEFTEAADYPDHRPRDHSQAEMIAWIAGLEPDFNFEPGTAWAYSNSGYVLLGTVIERVTGLPLGEAYQQLLGAGAAGLTPAYALEGGPLAVGYRRAQGAWTDAQPISMTIPGGAGALAGTATDTALALDALFRTALGPSARDGLMATGLLADGRPTRWGMPDAWREGLRADYGAGVFRDEFEGATRYWHSGDIYGFTSWFAHMPEEGLTVVILSNGDEAALPSDAILHAVLAGEETVGQ